MAQTGTYSEKLPCGGDLQVTSTNWSIRYYFPGLDRRYNGEFVSIPAHKVEDYIQAFEENWHEFLALKQAIPDGGEFSKTGRAGMTIRLGRFAPGVSLHGHHMTVRDEVRLRTIQESYRFAIRRASEIQSMLATLGT
jgi:hypothetical protein